MTISFSEFALVVLAGPNERARAAFARRHFRTAERVSLSRCLRHTGDAEAAFTLLEQLVSRRLQRRTLVVVDAPNITQAERGRWLRLARRFYAEPVLLLPGVTSRTPLPDERTLRLEGFHTVARFSPQAVKTGLVQRLPLPNDRRDLAGPFDIVGDIHGCFDELAALMDKLGYSVAETPDGFDVTPPPGRTLVFVGDLVDRGPRVPDVLRLAMGMSAAGTALVVPGNHDDKLMRALMGRKVQVTPGVAVSLDQLSRETPAFREAVVSYLHGLVSHYLLDEGRLAVAHAGIREYMLGRWPQAARSFTLYGETSGEMDAFGLPVRLNWMAKYAGAALVVYGHTPVAEPVRIGNTLNIDTGCVFGGALTAFRYPEMTFESVSAREVYSRSNRPFMRAEDF
jgi:protein phosphatase